VDPALHIRPRIRRHLRHAGDRRRDTALTAPRPGAESPRRRSAEAQDALRAELREYFARLITPDVRRALEAEGEQGGETTRRIRRQLGADGWLGIGWPVEYGGQGKGPEMQFIFFDEA
jgi:alkylation response protein AidB-like acyl-CoA dehydrogenase